MISIHALHEESDLYGFAAAAFKYSFQSTLSMRRATTRVCIPLPSFAPISIHALHEESDHHAFINGRRLPVFQSTLSMRRATKSYYKGGNAYG